MRGAQGEETERCECVGGKYENKWLLSFSGFGQVIVSFVCSGIAMGWGHRGG